MSVDLIGARARELSSHPEAEAEEIVVTAIGTCRIADPLAAAARMHPMRRNLANVYGFVHTSKEVLQQLDVLDGREIPPELVRFVASAEYAPPRRRGPTDLFFVEVSSLKEIHFRGHLLQINCLDRVLQGRRELFEAFFRHKYASERETRAERLALLPSFAAADPVERSVLLEGHVHITTRAELDEDLLAIARRLPGPVVFVSHIDVPDSAGAVIESRSRLCGWMREICAERGHVFFDPAPQVSAYGRLKALAEEGRDTNHYTTEFKSVLGSLLFETYAQPLMRSQDDPGAMPAPVPLREAAEPTPAPANDDAPPAPAPSETPAVDPPQASADAPAPAPLPADPRPQPKGASPQGELRALLAEAKARIARGDMNEAEVLLRGAAMDHPGAAEIFALLGSVSYHAGDSTAALADLRRALEIEPAAIEPKMMLVKIAQRLNRLDEACTEAMDLVASAPDDPKALSVAAKALLKAKRFAQAASVWRRVSVLRHDQAAPLTEVARCELKGRNYDEAVKAADAALARDADEAGALAIKAEALQRSKRFKELGAVALLLAAADPAAAMALVRALMASAHHEEAAAAIAAVRDQGYAPAADPILQAGLVRSLTQRARGAAERHDGAAAAAAWRAVLLLEPESKRAASGLRRLVSPLIAQARERAAAGDGAGAVAVCRRGLGFDPGNARLLRELAHTLERQGDWAGASAAWEAMAVDGPDAPPRPLLRAARLAAKAGHIDEALRIYGRLPPELLAEMRSTVASLTRKLVRSMREDFAAGRLEDAVRKARVALEADPGNAAGARLLSKAVASYRKLMKEAVAHGDAALQERFSRRILEIDPNRSDAMKVLSRIYSGARRWREAIEVQQMLTRVEPGEPRHWRKLSSACRAARRYDLGVTAALKAVELEPGDAQALERLSDMLNRQALAA